ncbi:MAG TPA: hypothetical protein VFO65_11935, partial [Acidimicrobiales bacterium]|nr:hypothetical protein [Acidimicrobiales bacterium]
DDDRGAAAAAAGSGLTDRAASARLGLAAGGLALWVAAVRECFEEAGVLLAEPGGGGDGDRGGDRARGPGGVAAGHDGLVSLAEPATAARFAGHRHDLHAGRLTLAALCRAEGLRLAVGRLHYFSHWITPAGSPRRFDARFLLARAPADQPATHDEGETTAAVWLTAAEALERHRAGELPMVLPTVKNLEAVAGFGDCDRLLDAARRLTSVPTVAPTIVPGPDGPRIVLPEALRG